MSELSWLERLERLERWSIPFRELLAVRANIALPKRVLEEIRIAFGAITVLLRYSALSPRWDLIEKYGHVSDDDAVADIDPHAGIYFFKSREYEIISHLTLLSRLMVIYKLLIVKKPSV